MGALWQDIKYGVHILRQKPGFTLAAAFSLALGIGANAAIFSVVNAALLRPLPYNEPERLVKVWESNLQNNDRRLAVSYANFQDWRQQSPVFEHISAFNSVPVNFYSGSESVRLQGAMVSANFFEMIGTQPVLGRAFRPEEDRQGGNRVVMLGYALWQQRFGADPNVLGRTVRLDAEDYTVIGVLPQDFQFRAGTEVWGPYLPEEDNAEDRGAHMLEVFARLRPGVSLEQAQSAMDVIASRLQQQYPESNTGRGIALVTLHDELVRDSRTALLILLGAVGLVLLIACANVANLLLARAASRQREVAIRVAIGASRWRIVRQLLTESVLLACMGGAAGLLLALWGVDLLTALRPEDIPTANRIALDGRALGFTALVTLLTGIVFGLAPALQASKPNLNESLKAGTKSASVGLRRNHLRNLFVVLEVALTLVLAVGAGLLFRSFERQLHEDPGFRPQNVLAMETALPETKYAETEQWTGFYRQALERVRALPGVESVGISTMIPLSGASLNLMGGETIGISFSIAGRAPVAPEQRESALWSVTSAGYFDAMGIRIVRGRYFADSDDAKSSPVAVISEEFARRYFSNQDPIGQRLIIGYGEESEAREIVGVIGNVRHIQGAQENKGEIYTPYEQTPLPMMNLVVRSAGKPENLAAAVRRELATLDPEQPISNVRLMETSIAGTVAEPRFRALLLSIFAAVALLLAAVGIFGVMSYSVAQRTHEIGIRMALGAQKRDVLRLVVGQGMFLVIVGIVVGIAASLALTRLMMSLLYGVSPTDLSTFTGVSFLLAAVALVACYLPARRATKVDPLIALRYE